MSWLLREGEVLAAIDPPVNRWPESIKGALVKRGPVLVHTLASATDTDVAWCADATTEAGEPALEVRRVACLAPRRVGRPKLRSGAVVAAEAGAFERWHLQVGDRLEIREA